MLGSVERAAQRPWRELLARGEMTIESLAEEANTLLLRVAPKQTRYKVTERVDVRTIRYYLARKLLPKACSYTGGRAQYDGAHLVRILMIKRLQAEGCTLRQIGQRLEGMSGEAIVQALFEATPEPEAPADPQEEAQESNRFHLSGGGTVEVPRYLLQNNEARKRLADDLRALARWVITGTR